MHVAWYGPVLAADRFGPDLPQPCPEMCLVGRSASELSGCSTGVPGPHTPRGMEGQSIVATTVPQPGTALSPKLGCLQCRREQLRTLRPEASSSLDRADSR
jgi:hypothetical protein